MDLLFEGYSLKMRCATFVDTFPVNEFFTAVRNDHASSPLCRSRNEELTLLIRSTNLLYEDRRNVIEKMDKIMFCKDEDEISATTWTKIRGDLTALLGL